MAIYIARIMKTHDFVVNDKSPTYINSIFDVVCKLWHSVFQKVSGPRDILWLASIKIEITITKFFL